MVAFGGHVAKGGRELARSTFAALQPASSRIRDAKGCAACIAEGASSNAGFASRLGVGAFMEDYYGSPDSWDAKTSAARVLASLNAWLYHQGRRSAAPEGALVTGFTALVLQSASLHLFHIGASRVYRYREGELLQLTREHCGPQGAREDILVRGLGMESQLRMDYRLQDARTGDLLLLTSGGLPRSLGADGLALHLDEALRQGRDEALSPVQRLETAARRLSGAALAADSQGGGACLLMEILELPIENLEEAQRRLGRLCVPPELEAGGRLDDLIVTRVLRSTARARYCLAQGPRFEAPVLLKLPTQACVEEPFQRQVFIRELWIASRLRHAGILRIHEPLPGSRFLYQVREYVEGGSLRQWLRDHPEPPLQQVRELVGQIAGALRAFQRAGMLHRDLRPENVLVTPQGRVKLSGFGRARVQGLEEMASPMPDEVPAGGLNYLAPEGIRGEEGEFRSDIFSLGVITYEMLTGELPWRSPGRSVRGYEGWQYRPARYLRRDLPLWVDLALEKACAPRPSKRYDSLSEFLRDLEIPNRQLLARLEAAPLLERNPLRAWQLISALLAALLALQVLL